MYSKQTNTTLIMFQLFAFLSRIIKKCCQALPGEESCLSNAYKLLQLYLKLKLFGFFTCNNSHKNVLTKLFTSFKMLMFFFSLLPGSTTSTPLPLSKQTNTVTWRKRGERFHTTGGRQFSIRDKQIKCPQLEVGILAGLFT